MPRAVQKPVAAIERFLLPQLNELKGMITAVQGTLEGKIDTVQGTLAGKIDAVQGTLGGEVAALRSEIKRLDEKIDNLRIEVLSEIRHVDEKTNERIAALRIHDRLARLEAKVGLLE